MRALLLAATALAPLAAHAATYTVGTAPAAGQFASLNDLAKAQQSAPFLRPGDEVDVQAGAYVNPTTEAKFWNIGTPAAPVTFKAVGGYVYLPSTGGVDKGELTFTSSDVVVDGFIFAGNPGGASNNSAGIRLSVNYHTLDRNGLPYPYNLTVRNSAFLMAADGMLGDDCSSNHSLSGQYGHTAAGIAYTNAPCTVSIDGSFFSGNGNDSGLDHAVYIDRVDRFTVTNSLFLGGLDGHLIKSRAFSTDIENVRLFGGPFAIGNSLIDIPVGGNLTVKNVVMEIGVHNYNGFINYNEEAYPPILNNVGRTIVISGNTFIDDWSVAHRSYIPVGFWDDSTDTKKTAPLTHAPAGTVANTTFTRNHFFGPVWNAGNVLDLVGAHGMADSSNTFAPLSAAPTLDMTSPVAWPPAGATVMQSLVVQMNGYELNLANTTHRPATETDPGSFPNSVLWWNGLPLLPAPAVVKADATATPPAWQGVTYQVPVIPGVPNFLAASFLNPGCCLYPSKAGRFVQWQSAALNGAAPVDVKRIPIGGVQQAVIPSSGPLRRPTPPRQCWRRQRVLWCIPR